MDGIRTVMWWIHLGGLPGLACPQILRLLDPLFPPPLSRDHPTYQRWSSAIRQPFPLLSVDVLNGSPQFDITKIMDSYINSFIAASHMYWDGQLKSVKGCWSNIGLLLHMLWVIVCFDSRRLMICIHGLFTANRWANADEICLTQEYLQIVRCLLWK